MRAANKVLDPAIIYGPGIQNYFSMQWRMIVLFFFLSILACCQMFIYRSFNGLGYLTEFVTTTADISLGNMGFSASVCSKMPVDWEHRTSVTLTISCQQTTQISSVISSGMSLDHHFPDGLFDANHDCYVDKNDTRLNNSYEMRQFRKEAFDAKILQTCLGKQTCQVEYQFYEFARLPPSLQRLNTLLFVQTACTQTEETLESKNLWGLVAACTGLAMCGYFWSTIQYLLRMDKITARLHDLEIITVDDYTAQTRLPTGLYPDFLRSQTDLTSEDVPIQRFTKRMIETIEAQLVSDNLTATQAKISLVHFGFNNETLLVKLEEMANALK